MIDLFSLKRAAFLLLFSLFLYGAEAQRTITTQYFSMTLNGKGYIMHMENTSVTPHREFCPSDKPSPLLCLYDSKRNTYFYPIAASYSGRSARLHYANGSVATVTISTVHNQYFKFVLQDVIPRHGIDAVQWGPYHTNITNLFGEIIGVARDTSETGNFAIGALALNDTTVGGPAADQVPFQYIIHTPDPKRFPLPAGLWEGENFSVGGDGINDVAFYSHPEEYFRMLYGDAASVDSVGRISIYYHAIDRRQKRSIYPFSPTQLPANAAVHQDVQQVPFVDVKGSSIAFYGCPDSVALLGVIRNIVLNEGLPYPAYAFNGSASRIWVKDPARYTPDVATAGRLFDSTISYVRQMGFKAVQAEDLPFYWPNRADRGYIDGDPADKFPFHFTAGNKTHKQFSDMSNPFGIDIGRHTVTTALGRGTKDVNPPSDSLCVLLTRILAKGIDATDRVITVTDPTYLDETGSAEGHDTTLNILKIGKELIHYIGVSKTVPYTLQNVTRGYWGTTATPHAKGDMIYKMQASCGGGYAGLIPDINLQDSIAAYYADVSIKNGIHFIDWDGEEFLFDQGMGTYSVKRFHRVLFQRAAEGGISYMRIMGAGVSEGSWHYQSVWNVGGGKNMYDQVHRSWGIEGKDIRNVAFANYFPATFGITEGIGPSTTVQQFENLEAISVGVGVTYMLELRQSSVESCPVKYGIFSAIRTWENARAAGAFPRWLKNELADPTQYFHLQQVDADHWDLYRVDAGGKNPILYIKLSREAGY
ncbi:hypothetical protein [Dinghuibacter silviterrae]|uniref:Uncharacterized protein n=1 Tax=Dinghuibacter silviterrae TaxID=1539049 RepID=A0A4R8DEQ3_9BACT|nr:hypothetical protein [Dinghuibacter silviterrae]TDW95915.1 hypothetical protein EDB95_3736 [Dinghuibacter silviterrae]